MKRKRKPRGQVNRNLYPEKLLGDFLYAEALKEENKTFVETGTWNGQGSTWCILEGILNSKKENYSFFSLEVCSKMHNKALKFLPKVDNFFPMLGKITDEALDLDSQDDSFFSRHSKDTMKGWLEQDMQNLKDVPNVLHRIPEQIDVLFLDGSEFQGFQEWEILAPRSKTILLDDTHALKFNRLKNLVMENQDRYEIIKNGEGHWQKFGLPDFLVYRIK